MQSHLYVMIVENTMLQCRIIKMVPLPASPALLNRMMEVQLIRNMDRTAKLISFKSTGDLGAQVNFPYNKVDVQRMHQLEGRKFHGEKKCWTCALTTDNLVKLKDWGFTMDPRFGAYMQGPVRRKIKQSMKIKGLKKKLYPFQEEGVSFIESRNGRALVADEMGLGKTVQALAWLQLHPELRPAICVVPAGAKLNWEKEARDWIPNPDTQVIFSTSSIHANPNGIYIINYDILKNWVAELHKLNPKVLIIDECFPAGTKISTPHGLINIEDIRKGDTIYTAIGKGIVQKIDERKVTNLIFIHLEDGRIIKTTPNHPFFTDHGWLRAEQLNKRIVFEMSDIFNILAKDINIKTTNEKNKKEMRMVWRRFRNNTTQKTFLRKILFSEMETYPSPCEKRNHIRIKAQKNKHQIKNSTCTKPRLGKRNIHQDEKKQPIFPSRSKKENQGTLEKIRSSIAEATITRRKRKTPTQGTTHPLGSPWIRMESRTHSPNKTIQKFRIPNALQNRYCFPIIQNRNRIGWLDTSIGGTKKIRSKKGKIPKGIRVEDITFQKSGSGGQSKTSTVYNLQVSGHPSYYAEGILVHNCHYIKTNKAQRTKAVKRLAKGIPHVVALSGTPIKNRPAEIYNGVRLVDPMILPEPWPFYKKFCGLVHNGFGWDWSGATNTKELHEILTESIMIRRLKEEVLPELPPKTRAFVPMPLDNRSEYTIAEDDFIEYLKAKKGLATAQRAEKASHLVQVESLKQLAVEGKIKHCIKWIEDFLEVEKKLVVFCVHRNVASELMNHFKDTAVKIVGGMSAHQKDDSVVRFQTDDKIQLFVGNIEAAGEVITLTAASHVAFIELPWTPGGLVQAEDRCHRIGQDDNVTVHFLLAQDTIDEKMAKLLDRKAGIINAVLDGKEEMKKESMLSELINEYL